jgi:hypothetical protein
MTIFGRGAFLFVRSFCCLIDTKSETRSVKLKMEHTIYKDPNDSERNGIIYGDIELENLDRPSMESINSYEMDRPSMDLERPSIESINSYTDNGTKLIDSPKKDEHVKKHGLGVVLGVMIPVYSTTFEIILFLRQPFVVGQAGVWLAILET